ncbi:MAG: hypothetical protein JWL59_1575 [Chthoniobacteraceae bacterium]|nr:hypothetical protein [Chthoniobacteraceae bacterium]
MNRELLNAKALAKVIPFSGVNAVNDLRRARKIPAIKLGYRTFLYSEEEVRKALAKLEIRAI